MAKLERMFEKLRQEGGMNQEQASEYIGECMEQDNVLFTDGDLFCAMRDVYLEAEDALKRNPEALATLRKHFGLK